MNIEINKRYGHLTVEAFSFKDEWRHKHYDCRCDCGQTKTVSQDYLIRGENQNCGCLKLQAKLNIQYGKLRTIAKVGKRSNGNAIYRCQCECGNIIDVDSYVLKTKMDCGCERKKQIEQKRIEQQQLKQQRKANKPLSLRKKNIRLYYIWQGMRKRCNCKTDPKYNSYGARGITVCDEWNTFKAFYNWAIANGWNENAVAYQCTIDRIDNNKGYTPDNCRWADQKTQQNNKRNTNK